MSDFRSLGTYTASGSVSSIVFSGLNVTPYSVIEIQAELKTDRSGNAWDAFKMTPSSGIGGTSGDGGTANTGVAYSSATGDLNGNGWNSANGTVQNSIVGVCAGATMTNISDRNGMPARILIFNPTKLVESTERDITVYSESTGGNGSDIGESAFDQDVYRSVVNWPARTDNAISSLTFTSHYSANFTAGSWISVYGYYQE